MKLDENGPSWKILLVGMWKWACFLKVPV
jgi:hypothetical protein